MKSHNVLDLVILSINIYILEKLKFSKILNYLLKVIWIILPSSNGEKCLHVTGYRNLPSEKQRFKHSLQAYIKEGEIIGRMSLRDQDDCSQVNGVGRTLGYILG